MIEKLRIHTLRNLAHVELALARCNLFVGKNGSGKTSLLEAVFLLSRGKTFRHHEPRRYITHHQASCTVWAKTRAGTLAIQKQLDEASQASTVLKINDMTANTQSVLSFALPTLLIDPSGMALLEEGSGVRRQLLDWLCFHVEPNFYPEWLSYQRLLKQRNALLKSPMLSAVELVAWDNQLSQHAKTLHAHRQAVFERWHRLFDEMIAKLLPNYQGQVTLAYQAGFDVKEGLFSVLQSRITQDKELGYTRVGAHRADVAVTLKQTNEHGDKWREQAVHVLSRGEKKLLIVALKLSQLQLLCQYLPNADPAVLIDDIDAELDDGAMAVLLETLIALPCQLFISSLQEHTADKIRQSMRGFGRNDELAMFHVEQGCVTAGV